MLINQEKIIPLKKNQKVTATILAQVIPKSKLEFFSDHIAQFPPTIADNDLCHTIVLNACKKMNKSKY